MCKGCEFSESCAWLCQDIESCLQQHKPACLSTCMLGQPVIINMLPSCHDICSAGWPLPVKMYAWPACHYSAFLPHARPVCHNAGLPQHMHSQPALPVCHNAGLPQFHMLGQPATMLVCHKVCSASLSLPAMRTP